MPEDNRYTISICKGAAMLDETRTLLGLWQLGEPAETFAHRVEKDGLLGKATAYRIKDIVRRVFVLRYMKPDDRSARVLKAVLESRLRPAVFKELVLLYSARKDYLLRDFVVREFWPSVQRGKPSLDVASALLFFSEALANGNIEKPWSEQVSRKVARGLLGFLREVDFIKEPTRGRRELVDYHISNEGLVLISRIFHEEVAINSAIVNHPDWGLFGLERMTVLSRLHLLSEETGLFVQQAGCSLSFNWKVDSIEKLSIRLRSNDCY